MSELKIETVRCGFCGVSFPLDKYDEHWDKCEKRLVHPLYKKVKTPLKIRTNEEFTPEEFLARIDEEKLEVSSRDEGPAAAAPMIPANPGEEPIEDVVEAPVEVAIEAPLEEPVEVPSEAAVEVPEVTEEAPVEIPVEERVEKLTETELFNIREAIKYLQNKKVIVEVAGKLELLYRFKEEPVEEAPVEESE